MADKKFFNRFGPFSLGELAVLSDGKLNDQGQEDLLIEDIATLENAGACELSFLDNRAYLDAFQSSKAGAGVVVARHVEKAPKGMALIISEQPYRTFALIAQAFYPRPRPVAGLSNSAIVEVGTVVGTDCQIEAGVVVAAGAKLGARCIVGANASIGSSVILGDDCSVGANVSLSHCEIGNRVILHPGARIGQDGFGFAIDPSGHIKVPQIGRVLIGDDCDIGANTTIDRGSMRDTVIGPGCWIDNLVQIGHNVELGRGCVIAAMTGISGSTKVGNYVALGGQVGLAGHLNIGDGAQIAAQSGIMADVPPGVTLCGTPAVPIKEYFRQVATLRKLSHSHLSTDRKSR